MNNSDLINKGLEFVRKLKEKIDYTNCLRIFYILDKIIYYESNNNNNLNIDGILLSWLFNELDDSEREEFYKENLINKENINYINSIINKIKDINIYKNNNIKNEEEEEEKEEDENDENNNENELKFELDLIKDSLILDEIGAFGIAKIFNSNVDNNDKNLISNKLNDIQLIMNIKDNLMFDSSKLLSNEKINFMIVFLKEIYNELNVNDEEKENFENFLVDEKIKLIKDYKNILDNNKKIFIDKIKKNEENRQNILKNLDEINQEKIEDEIFQKERTIEYKKLEKIEKNNEKKLMEYYNNLNEIFDDKNNDSFDENEEEEENENENENKNENENENKNENENENIKKILKKTGLTTNDIFKDEY